MTSASIIFKALVILLLIGILFSLASGLVFLVQDKGQSTRTVKALTVRIALSISLILLLLIGYFSGLINPRGTSSAQLDTTQAQKNAEP